MTFFLVSDLLITFLFINTNLTHSLVIAIPMIIGGFVATFLSRDNKRIYGIILGIIISMILGISDLILSYEDLISHNLNIGQYISFWVYIFIIILISGVIGGGIAKRYKESIIKKNNELEMIKIHLNLSSMKECIIESTLNSNSKFTIILFL